MLIEFENQEPLGMNDIRESLVCKCFTNLRQTWKYMNKISQWKEASRRAELSWEFRVTWM